MKKLQIDPEFKSLIPPLTKEEYKQLEENIINEGCRDSLVVWNDIIIDGHNRHEICTKNIIPFSIKEMDFDTRQEAIEWIIKNQFGRRNLPAYERAKLALKLKPIIQEKAKGNLKLASGGDRKSNNFKNQHYQKSDNLEKEILLNQKSDKTEKVVTDKELAKIAGVSHDTIHKVEVIENKGGEDIKEKLKNREISINKAYAVVQNGATKICNICGEEKPISEFYGNQYECKKCSCVRKGVGITAEKARELNVKFPDEQLNAIFEEMKKPSPFEEDGKVNEKNIGDSIITEFEKILNNFNTDINKYTFMEPHFNNAGSVKPLIAYTLKNLLKINNFIKE